MTPFSLPPPPSNSNTNKLLLAMKFLNLLQFYVTTSSRKLVDIAKVADVHPPDLSRVYNGKRPCSHGFVVKLLNAFDVDQQASLLQAWLRDLIPKYLTDRVIVEIAKQDVEITESPNPGTIEGSLELLRRAASDNNLLFQVIQNMALMYYTGVDDIPGPLL